MKFEKDETGITVRLTYDEAYLLGEGMSADIGYREMDEKRVHSMLGSYLQNAAFFHKHGYSLAEKIKREEEEEKRKEEEEIERKKNNMMTISLSEENIKILDDLIGDIRANHDDILEDEGIDNMLHCLYDEINNNYIKGNTNPD